VIVDSSGDEIENGDNIFFSEKFSLFRRIEMGEA